MAVELTIVLALVVNGVDDEMGPVLVARVPPVVQGAVSTSTKVCGWPV